MKAWHFVGKKLRDGRPIPSDGEWLVHDGPVEMCDSGLHFSRHPFDALQYAPGPVLCRVEVADVVYRDTDKGVCRRRMIVERRDVSGMLRRYARLCALDVIHLWDAPDVVVRYLKTGDESLRAAAWNVVGDAAAAWTAARDVAGAEARDVAWDAAGAEAWAADRAEAAAGGAAWATAWDAARLKQRRRFARMVTKEFAK